MQRMSKETIQNIIDFFEKKLDKSMIIKLWMEFWQNLKILECSSCWWSCLRCT
jgi:Iap family predicted aminopeptidase